MLYKSFLLLLCLVLTAGISAQYRNDNTAFKTVYLEDLCDALTKNPGHLLLDVRSKGEYEDTSSSANLNIGRLKGSVNIDINEISKHWKELIPYKKKPVFVYCSHSQRSRRVSKLLSDSGFTNVINVNGAMTKFNLLKDQSIPCAGNIYETQSAFKLVSPAATAQLIKTRKDLFILDIRSDSAYLGITGEAGSNALGRFKRSMNIPFSLLLKSLIYVPADKPILVVAESSREANIAAGSLVLNGYKDVYVLFNGLWQWLATSTKEIPDKANYWIHSNPFRTVTPEEMDLLLKQSPNTYVLDIRPKEEFNNESKTQPWKNQGHVKGAVNIPLTELANRADELMPYQNKPILLYSFGTGNNDVFEAARILFAKGFTGLHVLMGGIWDIRWQAANSKGLSYLNQWVEAVPKENL